MPSEQSKAKEIAEQFRIWCRSHASREMRTMADLGYYCADTDELASEEMQASYEIWRDAVAWCREEPDEEALDAARDAALDEALAIAGEEILNDCDDDHDRGFTTAAQAIFDNIRAVKNGRPDLKTKKGGGDA